VITTVPVHRLPSGLWAEAGRTMADLMQDDCPSCSAALRWDGRHNHYRPCSCGRWPRLDRQMMMEATEDAFPHHGKGEAAGNWSTDLSWIDRLGR
jgi:hypothetical protein